MPNYLAKLSYTRAVASILLNIVHKERTRLARSSAGLLKPQEDKVVQLITK
ncbi:MAG: hypothetical protein HQK56_14080 [Deltaproteobacteria bacterium]|nr:hypothetical protein [Deltaproteobacteria bacterium]